MVKLQAHIILTALKNNTVYKPAAKRSSWFFRVLFQNKENHPKSQTLTLKKDWLLLYTHVYRPKEKDIGKIIHNN